LTSRGLQAATIKTQALKTQPIKLGTNVGVRLKNSERTNLYVAALVIADSGDMNVLFPFGYEAPDAASLVAAGKDFTIPVPFEVYGTPGTLELLILMSREPLRQALLALKTIAARGVGGVSRGRAASLEADEADTVVSSLLDDVNGFSKRSPGMRPNTRAIDAGKLAALSAVFQVVQ
jgi:hypothetical protein